MKHACCVPVLALALAVASISLAGEITRGQIAHVENLIHEFPIFGSSRKKSNRQIKIIAQILGMPEVTEAHLMELFDPATDPLFGPDAEALPADRLKKLKRERDHVVSLLGWLNQEEFRHSPELIMLKVPAAKRSAAAGFLDRLCIHIRPAVQARILGTGRYATSRVASVGDLRLLDAMRAHYQKRPPPAGSYAYGVLALSAHAAGQRDEMRKLLTLKNPPRYAAEYLIRAGDLDFLTAHCVKRMRGRPDWPTCRTICLINTPAARETVLAEFRRPGKPTHTQRYLVNAIPEFVDEERARAAVPVLKSRIARSDRTIHKSYFAWLQKHKSRAGIEYAKANRSGWAGSYLIAMGDEETTRRWTAFLAEQTRGTYGDGAFESAVIIARGGGWEHIPDALGSMLKHVENHRLPRELLETAEEQRDRKSIKVVRMLTAEPGLTLRCQTLLLELGDRAMIAPLRKALPNRWTAARIPMAAALYRTGEVDQFDHLAKTLLTQGFPPGVRCAAAEALSEGPKEMRRRAASELVSQLLSPYGAVSEAAHKGLRRLSGRKDIRFSPWATMGTWRAEAAAWQAWLDTLGDG